MAGRPRDEHRGGRSAEAIRDAHPSSGSLANVQGALAFVPDHPREVQQYLERQDELYLA